MSDNINSITTIDENNYCIGTTNGFSFYNTSDNSFRVVDLSKIRRELIGNEMLSGAYDKATKTLWMASDYGLLKFVDEKYITTYYADQNNRALAKCWSVLLDKSGKLWIGTSGGICNLENDKIVRWKPL